MTNNLTLKDLERIGFKKKLSKIFLLEKFTI
jgi:hypothetical protein